MSADIVRHYNVKKGHLKQTSFPVSNIKLRMTQQSMSADCQEFLKFAATIQMGSVSFHTAWLQFFINMIKCLASWHFDDNESSMSVWLKSQTAEFFQQWDLKACETL